MQLILPRFIGILNKDPREEGPAGAQQDLQVPLNFLD